MKEFLAYVADDMLSKYGTDLSRVAVVFPNKRASLFLNEHLARSAGQPIWSPACITISELYRQQSGLQVADPIKLVCDLHKSFCQCTQSDETLDKFYGWGQLLLTDFDDIDKNMADADRVFANLRDIHELDDISYLTDEQRQMIHRFFSNFSENHNSELKERFLSLWSHFADIYHDFNRRLGAQGLAYEGALYRHVVEDLKPQPSPLPYDHYLFVGFNLLQKVEVQLFSELKKAGKAHFYWDFDHYYMKRHEAGQYISRYLEHFPNELDVTSEEIYGNFKHPKHVSYISAPTEDIQARYVSTWLRENQRLKDGRRTAIVLCNENLLQTVVHCLPDEVDKVNVTTGYPLSQTPVASLIDIWFNLQLLGRTPRLLRIFQRHPYARYISDDQQPLLQILREVATQGKDDISDPLFQESLFRAYTLVNRIDNLRQSGDLTVDQITLQRLITQIIQQTSIPFHGEPAEGIQVMGVLETRNLDFDHVLLLSCNEGNIPRGVNDSSFIPHSIRQAYELTTIENKVTIYAYYFHRLLQRAADVTILYNSSTEDGQRGEMSRFMLQLMVESPHTIIRRTLQSGQSVQKWQPRPIEKTPHVLHVMQSQFTTQHPILSPTAITRYMRCPLQFYYLYVADIQQPDTPGDEQELDNRIFGTIFHEAADIIYHQLPRHIDKPLLEHLLKSKVEIERAVDEAFHRVIPFAPKRGLQLINREVIIHYLRQLITIDMRLAPFTILGLEFDVTRQLTPHTTHYQPGKIGGRIDRLDLITNGNDEYIRVVDYKTGSKLPKPMPDVEAIFQPENIREHADYYLQTFVYADIIRRQSSLTKVKATSSMTKFKVSPALIFIQHAGGNGYDPTLCIGRDPVRDIAQYADRFCELLDEKITEMFSPDVPFVPTNDQRTCSTCPYAHLCRH
ncbi:MAG: PD-(D/E)XK nuclease family protein [Prevotella sp.]|nr:PD-(D/E)XK nuclease family protein [Prevotella sp.]